MSTQELEKIEETLLALNLPDLVEFVSSLMTKKIHKKSVRRSKIPKITWENCGAPFREMTPEEAKTVAEFEANPQLIGTAETAKFLKELKVFANIKIAK